MDNKSFALLAAKTLDDKKALDIAVIDIMEKATFADYLVIATGNSVKNIEGKQNSGWVLMDFGDIIVNIFTKEMREKYNIEKVWGDCSFLDLED